MANLSLVFDLIGRDVSASKTFRDVGDSADRAGRSGEGFGSKMSSGIKLAAGALLGAGLIAGFKALYDAAAESAKIGALTTQVIKSTGGAAGISAKQVGDLATAISNKTGVDDEAIQSGENLLLTFTNVRNEVGRGNNIFDQATGIITDMSVALGQDTSSSAIQLGKALNDPIKGVTALQRVGVSFTQSQKDQIATLVESGKTMDAQKLILAELSKEFGGAAEAAATPFGKLQVQLGNLAEQIGSYLIPVVSDVADFLMDDVLPAASRVGDVVGGVLGPALHVAGEALGFIYTVGKGAFDLFDSLPGPIQATVGVMAGLAVFKGPIGDLFSTIRNLAESAALKVLYAKDAISGLGGVGGTAKAGLGGLTSFLGGPWGIALTGATLGLSALVSWLGKSSSASVDAAGFQRDLADALKESGGAIDENVRALVAQKEADQAIGDSNMLQVAKDLGVSLPKMTDALLGNSSAYDQIRSQLNDIIDSSLTYEHAGDATWTANAEKARIMLGALNELAPSTQAAATQQQLLQEATTGAGSAMGAASGSAASIQQALQDTSDAAGEARKATDLFKTSLDVLTGATVDITGVEAAFWAAVDDAKTALDGATGSVLDQTGALDLHSEAGRKTRDQLVGLADDANSWISTMINQGATTAAVTAKDQELRDNFYNTALQMTHNKDAAQALTDKYYGIPTNRTTTIIADTGQAQATIDKFVSGINGQGLIGIIRTIGGHADGGTIAGWAPHDRADNVVIRATPGEFMQPVRSVRKYGTNFMEAVRSGAFPQVLAHGFADGGYINYPSSADFVAFTDMTAAAKGKLQGAFSGLPGPGGAVQRWAGLVSQALGLLGQPGSLVGAVLQLIKHESGGNPNAINLTDSNARAGHPSQGLMQTIPGTFNAYAGPYRGLGITNPLANIYAGLNYGIHRYRSVMNIPGIKSLAAGGGYRPYDSGGLLMPGLTMAYNGTGRPETVRTAEQEAALQGGGAGATFHLYDVDGVLIGTIRGHAKAEVNDFGERMYRQQVYR